MSEDTVQGRDRDEPERSGDRSESGARRRAPAARLGLLDATMVGVGAMIGAGIFVLTGLAAETAGPGALLVFALNGVVTAFTALSYAELASAIPKSGGGYAFAREIFPEGAAFLMGWMLWFAYMIAGSLYALGFASNLIELVHLYLPGFPQRPELYALGVIAVFMGLNALSTQASGKAETAVTLAKVAVLMLFVGFGLGAVSLDRLTPLFPGERTALALLPAMGLTFIAFEGYDLIATVSEEVENPRKNIPRAIFLSLAITVAVYLSVVFVALGTVGWETLGEAGETGIARAAEGFMPAFPLLGTGGAVIAFGAVFSTVSALNAVILASSRIAFAMGREDQLPSRLGRLHHRWGTPALAVVTSALVMLVVVPAIPIRQVGNLSSLFFLLSFVVVNAGLIRMRRERPDMERPFRVPFYPVTPVLGIAANLALGLFVDWKMWLVGLAWLTLGLGVHQLISRRRRREAEEARAEGESRRAVGSEPGASPETGDAKSSTEIQDGGNPP